MKESLKIITADGYSLSATRYIADRPTHRVMLINSATGVRQQYYEDFAGFFARQGYEVYTYDYRGIGESRPVSMRGLRAQMHEWGSRDYDTMVRNIFQTHPNARLTVIGHSVGGQLIGFSQATQDVDMVVMVGAQTPFWKNFDGAFLRARLWTLWNLAIPGFNRLVGYFPAKKVGLFEDLPSGVAAQWARWAMNENYAFDELPEYVMKFRALRLPALMLSFSDDALAPRAAVEDLMRRYANMKWHHWHFEPRDLKRKRIGHFGFFRKDFQESLWMALAGWINNPSQLKESQAA